MPRLVLVPDDRQSFALIRPAVSEQAPGRVREWAVARLRGWGLDRVADDVATVVTELVTNAWQAGAADLLVAVEWARAAGVVDVAVWDDAPGRPQKREADFVAENGRGLHLVEALAGEWGYEPDADGAGKTVWARLALDAS